MGKVITCCVLIFYLRLIASYPFPDEHNHGYGQPQYQHYTNLAHTQQRYGQMQGNTELNQNLDYTSNSYNNGLQQVQHPIRNSLFVGSAKGTQFQQNAFVSPVLSQQAVSVNPEIAEQKRTDIISRQINQYNRNIAKQYVPVPNAPRQLSQEGSPMVPAYQHQLPNVNSPSAAQWQRPVEYRNNPVVTAATAGTTSQQHYQQSYQNLGRQPQNNQDREYGAGWQQNFNSNAPKQKRYLIIHSDGTKEYVDDLDVIKKTHSNLVFMRGNQNPANQGQINAQQSEQKIRPKNNAGTPTIKSSSNTYNLPSNQSKTMSNQIISTSQIANVPASSQQMPINDLNSPTIINMHSETIQTLNKPSDQTTSNTVQTTSTAASDNNTSLSSASSGSPSSTKEYVNNLDVIKKTHPNLVFIRGNQNPTTLVNQDQINAQQSEQKIIPKNNAGTLTIKSSSNTYNRLSNQSNTMSNQMISTSQVANEPASSQQMPINNLNSPTIINVHSESTQTSNKPSDQTTSTAASDNRTSLSSASSGSSSKGTSSSSTETLDSSYITNESQQSNKPTITEPKKPTQNQQNSSSAQTSSSTDTFKGSSQTNASAVAFTETSSTTTKPNDPQSTTIQQISSSANTENSIQINSSSKTSSSNITDVNQKDSTEEQDEREFEELLALIDFFMSLNEQSSSNAGDYKEASNSDNSALASTEITTTKTQTKTTQDQNTSLKNSNTSSQSFSNQADSYPSRDETSSSSQSVAASGQSSSTTSTSSVGNSTATTNQTSPNNSGKIIVIDSTGIQSKDNSNADSEILSQLIGDNKYSYVKFFLIPNPERIIERNVTKLITEDGDIHEITITSVKNGYEDEPLVTKDYRVYSADSES